MSSVPTTDGAAELVAPSATIIVWRAAAGNAAARAEIADACHAGPGPASRLADSGPATGPTPAAARSSTRPEAPDVAPATAG